MGRTPALLGAFFVFAALTCALAGASLLVPGGPLDAMWSFKPGEHRQLLAMGPWAGVGLLALAIVMAAASYGTFRRRHWGWRLAIGIFTANAIGDALRVPAGAVAEGLIGMAAAGVVLWWLSRKPIRRLFDQ